MLKDMTTPVGTESIEFKTDGPVYIELPFQILLKIFIPLIK